MGSTPSPAAGLARTRSSSSDRARRALEDLPSEVKERGTSKSAVSRRFVAATRKELAIWLGRGLSKLELAAVMIDGLALVKAIRDRFGERALIQRCQVHKKRNVRDHLPEYNLARSLDAEHPSAAASVREGLAETLTVVRLGLPQQLCRILSTTNAIENVNTRRATFVVE
jgi:transposase-like protein